MALSSRKNYFVSCIETVNTFPENYLVDARKRFDYEEDLKAKEKQEQIELHEKMKREIYLNGGFVDCVQPGCPGQGTADTNYLCKPCYEDQRKSHSVPQQSHNSRSTFYVVPPPVTHRSKQVSPCPPPPMVVQQQPQQILVPTQVSPQVPPPRETVEVDYHRSTSACTRRSPVPQHTCGRSMSVPQVPPQVVPQQHHFVGHIVPVEAPTTATQMRVKLPSPTKQVPLSHPCKSSGCEFYGTPELDYLCSKCSKSVQ